MSSQLLYFDRNENQYGPAPACFDVLRGVGIEQMSVYSRDFSRGVKSILSERLAGDFGVAERDILLGYGAEDILKQTVHCYLGAGDRIMIPSHSWWYYKTIAEEVNGVSVEYPIVEGGESYSYDIPAMLRIYDEHKPAVVLISSPNNPTGNALAHDDLLRVLRHMREGIIVLDQAYWSYASQDNNLVGDLRAEFPNLLIVRTFSKYYALAGVRIGYAVMGSNLTALEHFSARYLGYSRLSELIALAALDSIEYYTNITAKMEEDRDMFRRTLGALPGFTVFESVANFVLVKMPEELCAPLKQDLTARGLIVKFMNEDELHTHMRITLGTQEQNRILADAIRAFVQERVPA
ncbi:MAG: histidinol-phosphate aminotransferase family protein [Bacteroidetes bacterium]|nr:histidinol-phosphate aminotransferase family protein [Bacteroidota bacterium]